MRRRRVAEQNPVAATQKFQESAPPTEYSSSYVQTPYTTSEVHGQGFVQMPQTSEVHGQGFVQTLQTSEVHGQGFVEAPYGSYYPTTYAGTAELNGQTMPKELPNQRY